MSDTPQKTNIQAKSIIRLGQAAQLAGSLLYAGVMWLLALYIIRFGGIDAYGRFAAVMAAAAPIYMLSNARGRLIVSTENLAGPPTLEYVLYRIFTSVLSLMAVLLVSTALMGNNFLIVLLVALFKSFEAISDIIYGGLQRAGQPQLVGLSQILKSSFLGCCLASCWIAGTSKITTILGFFAIGMAIFIIYEMRLLSRCLESKYIKNISADMLMSIICRIFRRIQPFMAVAFMSSLFAVLPRLFLERLHNYETLGLYSALMLFTSASLMITAAMGQPYLRDIGCLWAKGDIVKIYRILARVMLIPLMIGGTCALLIQFAGGLIFPILLNGGLEPSAMTIILLIAVVTLSSLTLLQWYVITAIGIRRDQIWFALASLIVGVILCSILIPQRGITGAFAADMFGLLFQSIVGTCLAFKTIAHRGSSLGKM